VEQGSLAVALSFPSVNSLQVFRSKTPPEAISMITKLLAYNPEERFTAIEALTHPFFDELRDPETKLPTNTPLPPLYDFSTMGNVAFTRFIFSPSERHL
jgi:serine/threonine protein kinase